MEGNSIMKILSVLFFKKSEYSDTLSPYIYIYSFSTHHYNRVFQYFVKIINQWAKHLCMLIHHGIHCPGDQNRFVFDGLSFL